MLIPVNGDYLRQTVYALQIRPGKFMPLVGNDAYAGALYSYIIAICMWIFGVTPSIPFIVQLVISALTVGLAFLLARACGLSQPWAFLVGLLMAVSPHHILLNSHCPGTVYVTPLFSTASLVALVLGVRRESGLWLVAAGALMGLAMQTNPIPALMLPGVAVWFWMQRKASIGLRTRWPYLAVLAFMLAYAPVIIYSLRNDLAAFRWASTRQYLWQPSLSLSSYLRNLGLLVLQLCCQVSGVLEGWEGVRILVGLPLVYSAWAIAGLAYAVRQGLSLPALVVVSHLLTMPLWSAHYGPMIEVRLTIYLAPLIYLAMSVLAEGVWAFMRIRLRSSNFVGMARWGVSALLVMLSLWLLIPLFQYYQREAAAGRVNVPFTALWDEFKQHWRGEKILLTEFSPNDYFLATNSIAYEMMPLEDILERLATGQETGRVTLALGDTDLLFFKLRTELIPWQSPAWDAHYRIAYVRWYTIEDAQNLKPTFVLGEGESLPSAARAVQVNFVDQLYLIGYQILSDKLSPGTEMILHVYYKAVNVISDDWIGFVHVVGPDGRLVAQKDQELGRGFYATHHWQPGEIIREKYTVRLPKDMPAGDYVLKTGLYSFPSLDRLVVRSSDVPAQDNVVVLGTIHVGP